MVDDVGGAETVGEFLDRLGDRTPTPAGGAVAALCAAQAAALVEMVARSCDDGELAAAAHELVTRAQRLGADDEAAYAAVAETWSRPRGAAYDEGRAGAVEAALTGAAVPQVEVVEVAGAVLDLAGRLGPSTRGGLHADLLAAVDVARAATSVARRNVGANLRGLPETEDRARLLRRAGVTEESA